MIQDMIDHLCIWRVNKSSAKQSSIQKFKESSNKISKKK